MQGFEQFKKMFGLLASSSALQIALIVLFFVFTIVAGNAVFLMHYRRTGKRDRSLFDLSSFPIFNFNKREWLLVALVFAISFAIAVLAILVG